MPEGPSLFKWCTMAKQFVGRKTTRICGSSKTVDKMKWSGASLEEVRVYGKRLFLHLVHKRVSTGESESDDSDEESVWIRCHFLMWGSVRVNEFNCKQSSKTNEFSEPRLVFYFSKEDFLVFYGGSFKEMNHPPEDESRRDILSDGFDRSRAEDCILGDLPISFILLDQKKFAGLGNIIKNEVLFSTGTHPMQLGCQLSRAKATVIVEKVVTFTKRWLSWKMEEKPSSKFGDWTEIYKKAMCPKGHETTKSMFGPAGKERITYWCPSCQAMNNHDDPLSERRVWTDTSDQDPETVEGPSVKGIAQTIPNSEDQIASADDTNMTESFAADQKVPQSAILTVKELKQEGTPANSNQELEFKEDFLMMQESQSSPKSEQTSLGTPHHQPEMNDTSLPTLSLETELNSFGMGHVGNKNLSPLVIEEPRQRTPSPKKIKLESDATCIFDLKEEEPAFTLSSFSSSCIVNSICVPDQQYHDEDSTRISVPISTIKELMRSHVRIKVKKIDVGSQD